MGWPFPAQLAGAFAEAGGQVQALAPASSMLARSRYPLRHHLYSSLAPMDCLTQAIAAAKPDLILFSGDFLNLSYLHDPRAWEAARAVLRELQAPLGVFAVTGSPAVDLPEVVPLVLEGLTHVRWLRDEVVA